MMEYKIIDISGWNNNLSYSKLKSLGITAAILRITQKGNKKDTLFDTHVNGLKSNNIPILGGYKFSYAMTLSELKEEANSVVNTLKNYPDFKNKVIYLDLEYSNQKNLGKATLTQFTNTFRDIVIKAGYKFGIYCNTDWYNNYLDTNSLPYDYWLAAYPYNDDGTIVEKLRPNKKGQVGWQYSSNFAVGNNRCDMSVFNKDYINNILNNIPQQQYEIDIPEKAILFMEKIATDDSHGYSQDSRWGNPDYDCSSLVIQAWEQAGVPVKTAGATYTGNMYNIFLKWGFKDVTNQVNLSTGAGMKRSDVLLNHVHHTAMYCGNGQEVEASINEKGGAHGGQPGDQTTREILIRNYRNYPWNAVLRYMPNTTNTVLLKKGSSGDSVKTLQKMLITCGYSCGSYGMDGDFGKDTEIALKKFQQDFQLEIDGIYGEESKKVLTAEYKKYPKKIKLIKKGYLRQGPSSKKPLIRTIKKNSILRAEKKVINKAGKTWYKVEEGYLNGERVTDV